MSKENSIVKATLTLLESGYTHEALEILSSLEKTAFGWKRLQDSTRSDFGKLVSTILGKNRRQRSKFPSGKRLLFKEGVLDPIAQYVDGYKIKKPWFRLQRRAPAPLIQTLYKSPYWRLFEKSGDRALFTTKKTLVDKDSKRNDLVLVADIRPRKHMVAIYFAHLHFLGFPTFSLLNQFWTSPEKKETYPEGTPLAWEFDDTVLTLDPDLDDEKYVGQGVAVALAKNPSPFDSKEPVQELLSRLDDMARTSAITQYKKEKATNDTIPSYQEWVKTYTYDVLFDHASYSKLDIYDKKRIDNFFSPSNRRSPSLNLTITSL